MSRTTPPRPLDVETMFPELSGYRRSATRLHPRPGNPGASDSSVGGPLLWPADEPWPVCTEPHKRTTGLRIEDIRLRRRILAEAWGRTPASGSRPGPTDAEREVLRSLKRGRHAPWLAATDPIPLLPVAQLYRRDVPDLAAWPDDHDLLQIFWCPFDAHGTGYEMSLLLHWRRSAEVGDVLAEQPVPAVVGHEGYVADPCVFHPEQILEHQYIDLLPLRLRKRIEEWEGPEDEQDEDAVGYQSDLSIAPGWKAGGFASWHLTDPAPMDCVCGQAMELLLSVTGSEWDGGNRSWIPLDDRSVADTHGANTPTGITVGRGGTLHIFTCPADPGHSHRIGLQ